MEAENTLRLPKELSAEVFFEEEANRFHQVFNNSKDEVNLEYLRGQLQSMKSLMTHLELPWDRIIPIIFRCFAYYMRQPSDLISGRKTFQYTSMLIDLSTYMSQNGYFVNCMVAFFDRQINDLDKLIAEKSLQTE